MDGKLNYLLNISKKKCIKKYYFTGNAASVMMQIPILNNKW